MLYPDDPPTASYLIDHAVLYRLAGSPAFMVAQMRQLAQVAGLPNVTMQVFPSVACPARGRRRDGKEDLPKPSTRRTVR